MLLRRFPLPLVALLPALLSGCFSPGDLSAQCEASARQQLAALTPAAELREFQPRSTDARTERSGGQTVHLGSSVGTLQAEQGGALRTWEYSCAVQGSAGQGSAVQLQLTPGAAGTPPAAPTSPDAPDAPDAPATPVPAAPSDFGAPGGDA